ncbi:Transcription factor IBH1 [Striga hermonthica]|uniref:Transcription factor IBH1 n=1 Tax=Striga hermonthica TaxID=68872 RepID=A0A9N7MF63_STRHE|nr:Transcription factor IBH1 [Striga hermonthica]
MKTHKNPTLIKTRFALNFLRAMRRLNRSGPSDACQRFHAIRAAATASMASAVGPRRAWSRAVLKKNRTRRAKNPRRDVSGLGQEDDLRVLVPGGQGLDFCQLLSESAHYIECLRAQVQVMTDLLDRYSA